MTTTVEQLAAGVPEQQRRLYLRALRGEAPPRSAIKAKCFECVAWERHDGGEDKIANCAVIRCPLLAYRPFQNRAQRPEVAERSGSGVEVPIGRPAGRRRLTKALP